MLRRALISLLALGLFALPAHAARRRPTTPRAFTIVRLGALFSLTGDGASLGTASRAALELAVRDINRELDALGSRYHVESDVADTGLTPATARQQIEALHGRGAQIVIGPQSSAEAAAVLSYANANRVIVVSQGSTASTLAIAGDYLFRLAPNDKLEGAAQAALMRADGVDTVVPIWRADAGNTGLHDSTKRSLETSGGTMTAGVSYDPTTTNFAATVTTLGNAVRAARSANPNAHIAVYLASFEEAVDIFHLARLDTDLAGVRWYGGDGVTQSRAIVGDASAAAFAATTHFTAPNVGLDETERDQWQPISDEIRATIGSTPDAYSLSVYDAAWVATLAVIEAENDVDVLRDSFVRNVQRYWGLTGPTALDAAGDRKFANFDFWTVTTTNGTTDWTRSAQYSGGHISR